MDRKNLSSKIDSENHTSSVDSSSVDKAVERASKDRNFILNAVEQLNRLKFPVYKAQIMDFLKKKSANDELLSLSDSSGIVSDLSNIFQNSRLLALYDEQIYPYRYLPTAN
jgi:hypothetical protein